MRIFPVCLILSEVLRVRSRTPPTVTFGLRSSVTFGNLRYRRFHQPSVFGTEGKTNLRSAPNIFQCFFKILKTYCIFKIMLYLVEFQVAFFCQIHFGQVVFLRSPFLNGLSYKVAVALDCKIIQSRLRISHNLISFIEILSSYG